uniref:ATP-dependent DNA helicase n=1 Tax=Tanacetum cinerariifolium TaxID=118510 RepID=A0A6L2KD85_TANCI|nr:DNA helicase [Tanacetum cinerariifolium]
MASGDNRGCSTEFIHSKDTSENIIRRPPLKTRNYAYLYVDTKDRTIRPAIRSFLNNIQENRPCSSEFVYNQVFAANEDTTANVWIRKNTHTPLVARAEEAISSRTVNTDRKRKNTSPLLAIRPEDALCNAGDIPSFKIRLYNIGGVIGYELPTADVLGAIVFENGPKSRFYPELSLKPHDGRVFWAIEQSRLDFIHRNQNDLRSDFLSGLYDAVSRGYREGIAVGSKIMLPSTFTGGPRYMYNHYLDALAIFLYTIEFQKRRLLHCHTLLWTESRNTLKNAPQIDEYISVEIPDHVQDPIGPDHILAKISNSKESTFAVGTTKQIDKIQNYVDGRFICPYEACWRIFDFLIHCREPAVQILNVNLEDMQRINFRKRDRTNKSLERLTYVHPSSGDLFYFRILLCHQKRCKSPDEVITVNCQMLATFRAACEALGSSSTKQQELLFFYGHGGTGKTFLWKTIVSSLRSEGKIVLAVAFSGISSLLLPAGRTAHSRFKLPLELTDESFFRAKKKIKKGAEKEELIAASIAESYLWGHFRICILQENMRLLRFGLTNEERKRSETFAKWLLNVGGDEIGEPKEED